MHIVTYTITHTDIHNLSNTEHTNIQTNFLSKLQKWIKIRVRKQKRVCKLQNQTLGILIERRHWWQMILEQMLCLLLLKGCLSSCSWQQQHLQSELASGGWLLIELELELVLVALTPATDDGAVRCGTCTSLSAFLRGLVNQKHRAWVSE